VSTDAGGLTPSINKLEELKAKVAKGYVPDENELLEMIDSVAFAPIFKDKGPLD